MTPSIPAPGALQQDAASGVSYRVMQPQPARPRALLVLLHGVGGQETDLADLASGVDPETLVVLVRSRIQLGPGQFGWFRVAFSPEGPKIAADEADQRGPAAQRAHVRGMLHSVTRACPAAHRLGDQAHVCIAEMLYKGGQVGGKGVRPAA